MWTTWRKKTTNRALKRVSTIITMTRSQLIKNPKDPADMVDRVKGATTQTK